MMKIDLTPIGWGIVVCACSFGLVECMGHETRLKLETKAMEIEAEQLTREHFTTTACKELGDK